MELKTEAAHLLESEGQASLAGSKCDYARKPLTCWRTRGRHHHQSPNAGSHSQTGESRTGIVSGTQMLLTEKTTHELEDQGHASLRGSRCRSP